MRNRLGVAAAVCLMVGLAACGSKSSPTSSNSTATHPRPAATSTRRPRPSQSIDATGQAYLMHAGTDGFKLYGGRIISATLGNGQFVEDGIFSKTSKNPSSSRMAPSPPPTATPSPSRRSAASNRPTSRANTR